MSRESLASAKLLAAEGRLRNSVSRAYYAAYAAVAGELAARGMSFAHGWNNPGHEQLPSLISHTMALPQDVRRRLSKLIRVLRHAREDADYRPGIAIDRTLALNCLRDAIAILRDLGVPDE
jgi:uncharacterized protein (UPF0332 family)